MTRVLHCCSNCKCTLYSRTRTLTSLTDCLTKRGRLTVKQVVKLARALFSPIVCRILWDDCWHLTELGRIRCLVYLLREILSALFCCTGIFHCNCNGFFVFTNSWIKTERKAIFTAWAAKVFNVIVSTTSTVSLVGVGGVAVQTSVQLWSENFLELISFTEYNTFPLTIRKQGLHKLSTFWLVLGNAMLV